MYVICIEKQMNQKGKQMKAKKIEILKALKAIN